MTSDTFDREALQVLRFFNAAASTVRLYPQTAPQVKKSVERAYQEVKSFVKKYRELSFGFEDDQPMLCSQPLFSGSPDRIKEFPVFNHLKLTGLKNVLFKQPLRRSKFEAVLDVFSTRVEEIKKAGGGLSFALSLGIGDFFPDRLEIPEYVLAEKEKEYERQKTAVIAVPPHYLHFLFGKDTDPQVEQNLKRLFGVPEKAMAVITSAIAYVLRSLQKERGLLAAPLFPLVLLKVDQLLLPENRKQVATSTASFLVKGLKEPALCVLLSQKFPTGFGDELYSSLVQQIDKETLEGIIALLKRQVEQIDKSPIENTEKLNFLKNSFTRLTATNRGKQVVASEKVSSLIKGTEQQRREKRFQTSLQALLQGDTKQLRSREFLTFLPATISTYFKEGKDENITLIVDLIGKSFLDSEEVERKQTIHGLAIIAKKLIELKIWQQAGRLIPHLLEWLHQSDERDEAYETCALCLQTLSINGWSRGENEDADRISRAFFKIRTGAEKKPAEIVELIGEIQDRGFAHHLFVSQLSVYLKEPQDRKAGLRLTRQGPPAGRFLLHSLLDSDRTDERLNILELLGEFGNQLSQIILEVINEPMPWFKRRNLIKLLGEAGDEGNIEVIARFLNHDDRRVQQEAFACIYKISGANRKKHLLSLLPQTRSSMRPTVVKALIPYADEEVAKELITLLNDIYSLADQSENELIENICDALGRSLSLMAIEPLQKVVEVKKSHGASYTKDVAYRAATKALKQIKSHEQRLKEKSAQIKKVRKDASRRAAMIKASVAIAQKKVSADSQDDVLQIERLLSQGDKEKATQLLLDTIVKMAKARQFAKAEKLRQRLIEVDPMALQDIIKAAEIIEEEKAGSIDAQQLQVWSNLYENLTTEEFNHLYCSMDKISYSKGDIIVEQGAQHPCLYFINNGKVKLFYKENKKDEVLIKNLESGHIFGAESFFTISVWTMGAMALTDTELSVLSLSDLNDFQDDFPALESKLGDFCRKHESIEGIFSQKTRERREHKRYPITGKARLVILDDNGNETDQKIRGEFADISSGGTIIYNRISRKEIAQKMLGRNVSVALPLGAEDEDTVAVKGVIIAVRGHNIMENEYSIHIRFQILLDNELLGTIVKIGQKHD